MIVLSSTSDVLHLTTSAAAALDVHSSFVDNTSTTFTPGRQPGIVIASIGTTTVVPSPGASTQRGVKHFRAHARGGGNTITVEHFDGTTAARLLNVALLVGETLEYEDGAGWRVLTAEGSMKGLVGPTGPQGPTGATGSFAPAAPNSMPANATVGVAAPADLSIPTNAVVGRVAGNIVAAPLVDAQVSASAALASSKLASIPANALVVNPTALSAVPTTLAPGTNTVVGRVAGNLVAAQLVDAQVAAGTLSNASHANMADGTVKLRPLGAGAGVQTDGTAAQLGAIAAPQLAGSGLVAAGGALNIPSLYADVLANVPTVVAAALGFVDVSTALTPVDPLAINDKILVLPRADAPPFTARVSAANTVRIGFQGAISPISNAPFRIYKQVSDTSSPQPYVSAWLRAALATSDVNGISSLPDVLNANPAVQATNARKPALGAAANGLPIVVFGGDDALSVPVIAANNGTAAWGFATWLRATSLSAPTDNLCAWFPPNTSGYKVICTRLNQQVSLSVANPDGSLNVRRGLTTANVVTSTTAWFFLTFEWDSTGFADAQRFTITVNGGAPQALTIATQAGTPAVPITTLSAPTGAFALGAALSDASSQPMTGAMGPNIYFLGAKMAGATVGLLTPAARLALMNFEVPT